MIDKKPPSTVLQWIVVAFFLAMMYFTLPAEEFKRMLGGTAFVFSTTQFVQFRKKQNK